MAASCERSLRAYSFGHLLKTVDFAEAEIPFFITTQPKTVDFADFRSFFTKAHSLGHSVFGRFLVFFWALLKTV